jgi:hypothetical protein
VGAQHLIPLHVDVSLPWWHVQPMVAPFETNDPERVQELRRLGLIISTMYVPSFSGLGAQRVSFDAQNFHLEVLLTDVAFIEWGHGHDVEGHYVSWTLSSLYRDDLDTLERVLRLIGVRDPNRDARTLQGRQVTELDPPEYRTFINGDWPPPSRQRYTPHGPTRAPVPGPVLRFQDQVRQVIGHMLPRVAFERRGEDSLAPGEAPEETGTNVRLNSVSIDAQDPSRLVIDASVRVPHAVNRVALNFSVPTGGEADPHDVNRDTLEHRARLEEEKRASEEAAARRFLPGRKLDI